MLTLTMLLCYAVVKTLDYVNKCEDYQHVQNFNYISCFPLISCSIRGPVLCWTGHQFHKIRGPLHLSTGDTGATACLFTTLGWVLIHQVGWFHFVLFILTSSQVTPHNGQILYFQASCGFLCVPGFRPLRGGAVLCAMCCSHGAHQTCQHPRSEWVVLYILPLSKTPLRFSICHKHELFFHCLSL